MGWKYDLHLSGATWKYDLLMRIFSWFFLTRCVCFRARAQFDAYGMNWSVDLPEIAETLGADMVLLNGKIITVDADDSMGERLWRSSMVE